MDEYIELDFIKPESMYANSKHMIDEAGYITGYF